MPKTKHLKTRLQWREYDVRALDDAIDEDARTVKVSFSSEAPVPRFGGLEILEHSAKAVNLGRLTDGAPVLFNHDPDRLVGVVEKARISKAERMGRAVLRFGRTEDCEQCFQKIADGILTKVSVGYAVHRMLREENDGDEPDVYRVTDWEPFEISMVAMPADVTVGVGRTGDLEFDTEVIEEDTTVPNEQKRSADESATTTQAAAPAVTTTDEQRQAPPPPAAPVRIPDAASAAKQAQQTAGDIMALGRANGMIDQAAKFIEEGRTVEDFRGCVIDTLRERAPSPLGHEPATIGMSQREIKRYSLLRVINLLAEPNNHEQREAAAFELECSRAVADAQGVTAPQGVYLTESPDVFGYDWSAAQGREVRGAKIPADVLRELMLVAPLTRELMRGKRDLTAGTATDGAELVATNLLAGSFIDVLRNAMVVASMGATMLRDLAGDVAIPRKTSGASGAWIATENTDAAESDPQFDQVTMTPRTVGAFTEISRQLRLQSSLDVENLVRMDLMQALALTIDLGALYGSGASGQPTGIANQSGINTPTNFAAVNPTFAEVVAMETPVATSNALLGRLGYICRADMRGSLKTTLKDTGVSGHIWEPGNQLNGYPASVTSQVTAGDLFFGNMADLLIGMWAGLDLLVDPYTGSPAGRTRLVAHQSVDVAVRHPESFSFNNDGV